MNKKAFLFTISVIIFASTLLIMTQLFSSYSLNYERTVLSSYKTTLQPYLNDDITFDLERLMDLELDYNYSLTDINITINSSTAKQFNFAQKLSDYNDFLNNTYFPNVSGTQSLNFNVGDDTINLLFGGDYEYKYNYDNNIVEFSSSSDILNIIDLNLDLVSTDLNRIEEPSNAGSSVLNINYNDDQNYFSESYTFHPTATEEIIFVYNGDYNLAVTFGDTGTTNSIKIDSNSPGELSYNLKLNYSFDSIQFPIYYDLILSHNGSSIDSNSYLKISS